MGFLDLPGGRPVRGRSGDHRIYECPKCKKMKLYWNPAKDIGTCFSGICGERTYTLRDLREIMGFVQVTATELINYQSRAARQFAQSKVEQQEATESEWVPAKGVAPAMAFLCGEKTVHPRYVDKFLWNEETREVGVPITSRSSTVIMRRSIDNKGWFVPSGCSKGEYFFQAGGPGNTLVLVEGVFDAVQVDLPGVVFLAQLGTKLHEAAYWAIKHAQVKRVIVWLDPDLAGDKAKWAAERRVRTGLKIPTYILNHSTEPGDTPAAEIKALLESLDKLRMFPR